MLRSFASDNNAGVSSEVLEYLAKVNNNHAIAYGDDEITQEAIVKFKEVFGNECQPFLLLTGTAANVTGIANICKPFQSVVAPQSAHINVDECGAVQRFTGCAIQSVEGKEGKLTPEQVEPLLHTIGFEHHSQPKLISISQCTELGTLYTIGEIKELADFAHKNGMYLHMDGARLANAAVALNEPFKKFTTDAGVDLLSFGGTKNGLMAAESMIFMNKALANNYKYIRKQGMQLVSKMRYVAAQFLAYFENELWKRNAGHANYMAKKLYDKLAGVDEIITVYPVETNAVFVKIPREIINPLQNDYFFYEWDEKESIVRWMTSFDTTEDDILSFTECVKKHLRART